MIGWVIASVSRSSSKTEKTREKKISKLRQTCLCIQFWIMPRRRVKSSSKGIQKLCSWKGNLFLKYRINTFKSKRRICRSTDYCTSTIFSFDSCLILFCIQTEALHDLYSTYVHPIKCSNQTSSKNTVQKKNLISVLKQVRIKKLFDKMYIYIY